MTEPRLQESVPVEIPVQSLPTGDVVFVSGSIALRYVEVAEAGRLRAALQIARFALLDVKATRKTDAWGNAVTEATKALAAIEEALDA